MVTHLKHSVSYATEVIARAGLRVDPFLWEGTKCRGRSLNLRERTIKTNKKHNNFSCKTHTSGNNPCCKITVSPRIVFMYIKWVGVHQQSTPREEAARGQQPNVWTRAHVSWNWKVDHHLLGVDHQTILWYSSQQDPTRNIQMLLQTTKNYTTANAILQYAEPRIVTYDKPMC